MGTYLCVTADWNREVEKVKVRLEREDKQRREEMRSKDNLDGGEAALEAEDASTSVGRI